MARFYTVQPASPKTDCIGPDASSFSRAGEACVASGLEI